MKTSVDILSLFCEIILLYQIFLLVEMSKPLAQEAKLTHQSITTELLKIKKYFTPGILAISMSRQWIACKATLRNSQGPSQTFTELQPLGNLQSVIESSQVPQS